MLQLSKIPVLASHYPSQFAAGAVGDHHAVQGEVVCTTPMLFAKAWPGEQGAEITHHGLKICRGLGIVDGSLVTVVSWGLAHCLFLS